MENRLLLAFVLSLAVFVGWGYFLAQIQGPLPTQEPGDVPVDAQALPPRASGSTPSVSQQSKSAQPVTPIPVPVNPFPGEEVLIQVSTGKSHFVISNRGGVLKQLELPRFKNDSGDIIDLIDNPDHLTPALALQANDPEITSILQNAHYEASTTSIVLDESIPEGTLTLTLNHPSGIQVTRTYVFHYNDFMVELSTQIS
ncbi:MAG: membrane protein insertase YidC, partial [Nitrospina sp.]|nr:membrane protein insertase YidC [Nitrospina sp.]